MTYKSDGKVLVGDVAVAQRGSLPCHRWMKCVGSHPFLGWKKTTGLGKICFAHQSIIIYCLFSSFFFVKDNME